MTQIKLRRDTSANFASANPVLGTGEPAYETDTKKLKIGDGTTAYNSLDYFTGGSSTFEVVQPLKLVDGTLTLQIDEQTIQVQNGKLVANLDELGNEVNDLSGRVTAVEADVLKKQDKIVTLTQEAYDALAEKNPETIYMIEGETSSDLPIASATTLGGVKVGDNLSITVDGILSAVGGPQGADTNLSNLTNLGKAQIAHLAMPSDKYTDLTLGASGSDYTAPSDGWYYLKYNSTSSTCAAVMEVRLNGSILYGLNNSITAGTYNPQTTLFVRKGTTMKLSHQNGTVHFFRFIYAQGTESEAQ